MVAKHAPSELHAGSGDHAGISVAPTPDLMRAVHRQSITGVAVLTTSADGEPRGLTLNAIASVSLEPPVILVCLARTAATHEWLFRSDRFAINVLATPQARIAGAFARSSGAGKFDQVPWHEGTAGAPILDGVAAYMEANVETRLQAYTHTIFVARVTNAEVFDRWPLAYMGGRFFDTATLEGVDTPCLTDPPPSRRR